MSKELHHHPHLRQDHKKHLVPVYACSLLLSFHAFIVAYLNSSFLEQFISREGVGMVYTVGSALSILIFLFVSRVLHKVGNYKMTLFLLTIDFLAIGGMAFADTMRVAIPLFLIHLISVPLIYFNLDVLMESEIGEDEGGTGSSRGLILTLSSIVGALSPLIGTNLISGDSGFTNAYLVSAAFIIPVILILTWYFRRFNDPDYEEVDVLLAVRHFWENINLRYVYLASFTLQFFFMVAVVYVPLYMTDTIGLSWKEFGIVMFWAQTAYIIFEYPIGIIADKYIGEKEMMAAGFLLLALSTSWLAFVTSASLITWSLIMFATRTGASLIEVTTESYFFKKTTGSDSQVISFFRTTRPLAYVLGAMVGSLSILFLPFNLFFVVVALLMVPSIFFAVHLVDTK